MDRVLRFTGIVARQGGDVQLESPGVEYKSEPPGRNGHVRKLAAGNASTKFILHRDPGHFGSRLVFQIRLRLRFHFCICVLVWVLVLALGLSLKFIAKSIL